MVSLQGHSLVSICLMNHRKIGQKEKSENAGRVGRSSVAGLTSKNFLPQNIKFCLKGKKK